MPQTSTRFGAVSFVHGDTWHILGGYDSIAPGNTNAAPVDTTLAYRNGVFAMGKNLVPGPRTHACVARVNASHVFFAGGAVGRDKDVAKMAYLLEVDSWTWTHVGNMSMPR